MIIKQQSTTYPIGTWIIALLISFATVTYIGHAIRPGLDPSYKFAFNYFFEHHIQIGTDVLFTLGPLGFIYAAMPIGDNILIATIVTLFLKFIFLGTSLQLYKIVRAPLKLYHWAIPIIVSYEIASGIGIHHVILFIPLISILLYEKTYQTRYLYLSSMITVLGLLIKSSTGITIVLMLISYSLYTLSNKRYKAPITLSISTILMFLLSWFILYHNLNGIAEYFYATFEFSKGNSSVMTLNPDNKWSVFTVFLFIFISYPFVQKDKLIKILFLIMFLTTIAIFKFAISREDHIFEFENYLFDLSFIIYIASKHFTYKSFIHIILIYTTFLAFIYYTPWGNHIKGRLQLTHTPQQPFKNIKALDTTKVYSHLRKISNNNLKKRVLDKNITHLIGNDTIDTYPTFTTYFYLNHFHWTPRPVFQSYITYTPYLDNKNAIFYNSNKAPEFILWSREDKMNSLGGQYLLNNAPKTLFSIFNHYNIITTQNNTTIFKHTSLNNLQKNILFTSNYNWNTWIDVPQLNDQLHRTYFLANTSIKRTFIQKIKKLIYKEFEVYIEYKLHDNSIKRHRIAIDTAIHGLWVNPLPNKLFQYSIGQEVKAIRFVHMKYDYFEPLISIRWEKITSHKSLFKVQESKKVNLYFEKNFTDIQYYIESFSESKNVLHLQGWAFVKNSTVDETKKYIVLMNQEKTFFYTTNIIERGDITRHFHAKNLHHAGFEFHLNKQKVPIGKYTLSLLLIDKNKQQSIVSLNKEIEVN